MPDRQDFKALKNVGTGLNIMCEKNQPWKTVCFPKIGAHHERMQKME